MVQALLRLYSYVFQFLVSLILLALGIVASLSDNTALEISLMPWSGKELRMYLLILGALGVLATVLAFKGSLRLLFVMWTLGTTILLARGIFISGHQFAGEDDFKWTLLLLAGFIGTVPGAWRRFKRPAGR